MGMRLGIIACEVFARELSAAVAVSTSVCRVRWLAQGLHDSPEMLRSCLQQQIDSLQGQAREDPSRCNLDAIVLGYGLCGGATAGLKAGDWPLVIPRTEDCMGVLLGGAERYEALFRQYQGIYWLSSGWCERANLPGDKYYSRKEQDFTARFGADNANWLIEQENAWIPRYTTCIYVRPPMKQMPDYIALAQETAAYCKWNLVCEQGNNRLLDALLAGDWEQKDFQIWPPGSISQMSDRQFGCSMVNK